MHPAASGPSPAAGAKDRELQPAGRRVIVVGIRQVRRDAAALRWAMFDAQPGRDVVAVVHAVEPIDGGQWGGWEEIATAVALASRQRPGVAVIGAPAVGPAEQVLQAESDRVALLVLGQDDPGTPHRRIATHLRRTAHCPVVCVPPGDDIIDASPVTVVANDVGRCGPAMEFAAQYAERHRASLQVSHARTSRHGHAPSPAAGAGERAALDAELTGLRASHPHLVITTRIEGDGNWLRKLRAHSNLIVVGRATARRLWNTSPPGIEACCPVAFIPDRWLAAHESPLHEFSEEPPDVRSRR